MPRRNDIAKMFIGVTALAVPSAIFAKERDIRVVFCVPGPQGGWSLQAFKPLIDPPAKTSFAEMSLAGPQLVQVRLRRFSPDSEVMFEYKFDEAGRLNALEGTVKVFGSWEAEANVLPNSDGSVPPYQVLYRRNNERVQRPENAARYISLLNDPPIYRTAQSAPCALMIQGA
jgi:hypothetical protein